MILFSTLFILVACSSTKTASNQPNTQTMEEQKEMLAEGYLMGTIMAHSSEGNCPYIIEVVADPPYYFDPINLDENFKKEGEKIWFTFAGLRMMNRCEKANPVSILDIKKRAE